MDITVTEEAPRDPRAAARAALAKVRGGEKQKGGNMMVETQVTITAGGKEATISGEELSQVAEEIAKRNPNCSPVQLALFDGFQVDENTFSIKGSKLETHDFDGPIKLGRFIEARVSLEVTEIKAVRDSETGALVRKHVLQVVGLKSMEGEDEHRGRG